MPSVYIRRFVVAALVAFVWPSIRTTAQPASPTSPGTQVLLSVLRPGATIESFLQNLNNYFVVQDVNGDGRITADDAVIDAKFMTVRSRTVALTSVLECDLDGDGMATENEIRQALLYQYRHSRSNPGHSEGIERLVKQRMLADANGDGRVTFAEALAYANKNSAKSPNALESMYVRRQSAIFEFDADRDGAVTLAELKSAGEALFRIVDADGNGQVSKEELTAFGSR
jgi:Ca2+-binding EF-hand superfamily protein